MGGLDPVQRRIHEAALRLFAQTGSSRLNVRDLAQEAGVARGTIYNNVGTVDTLFEVLIGELAAEMHERIHQSFGATSDPAQRLASGIRLIIRRAHEEPHWGRFMCRFCLNAAQLREVWLGQPMKDLRQGIESGRYAIREDQLTAVTAMLTGSTLAAGCLVLDGYRGWREAGSETAELLLRALGLAPEEAKELANAELPLLPQS